jgi:hypothetical protein
MNLDIHPSHTPVRKIIGLAGAGFGLFLVAIAWSLRVAHTHDGGFTLEGWWTAMAGVVVLLLSVTWWSAWRLAGLLTGTLVFGMAAQLTLISPHGLIYFRLHELRNSLDYLSIAVLFAQFIVVSILVFPHGRNLARTVIRLMTVVRVLVAGLVFLACAAHITLVYPEILEHAWTARIYLERLIAALYFVTVNLLLLWRISMAVPLPDLRSLQNWFSTRFSFPGEIGQMRRYDRVFPWWVALFTLVATGFISLMVFDGTPHIPDDAAYLFHARTFASGELSVPAPPVPEAFQLYTLVVENGRWFSVTIPGWPAWLSLGVLMGIPWLVNPVTAALSIPVAHAVVRRIADHGTAHLVALLLASSPWFMFISASLQPQPVTLLFSLLAFLGILRAGESHSWRFALLGGLAAGLIFCVRPLDGVLFGGILGVYMLGLGGHRLPSASLIGYGAGCLLTGSLVLLYNQHLTGNWLEFPINAYFDQLWSPGANRLGFGPDVGRLWGGYDKIPGHGWRDVLLNINQNLFNLNTELFGWCIGSLFPVVAYLLFSRWSAMDRFFLFSIGVLIAGLSLYWFSGGSGYGPRYWYLMIFPMVYFGAQGCLRAAAVFGKMFSNQAVSQRISAIVAVLIVSNLVVFVSWHAVAKYPDFWSNHDRFRQLMEQGVFGTDGLVLVETAESGMYTSAFYLNDISPDRTGPVFARYESPELTRKLLAAYPDRPVYHVRADWNPEGNWLEVSTLHRGDMSLTPLTDPDSTWNEQR